MAESKKPSTDARDYTDPARVGGTLRDASVDPRPGDYLPPTNAGKADPHGPLVVAPGIHGVGPKPIRAGEVFIDNPDKQEKAETALAESSLVEGKPSVNTAAPKASKTPRRSKNHGR